MSGSVSVCVWECESVCVPVHEAVTRLRWEQHKSSPRRRLALLQPVNRAPCTACRTDPVGPPPGHVLPWTSSPAGAGGGAKSQTGGWGVWIGVDGGSHVQHEDSRVPIK